MARIPDRWIPAATLCLGVALGVLLTLGVPHLAAQPGAPARPAAPPPSEPTRPVGEDAIYGQLARQYSLFEPINRTFEMVAKVVSPAVVHIVSRKVDPRDRKDEFEETGSGVIIRPEGVKGLYVLTNNHVIEGATVGAMTVYLQDGRTVKPQQAWLDDKADIAVLKLPDNPALPAARLGDSDEAAVGSWVLALGSPFGLTHSVTQGIISARGRHEQELQEEGVENQDFLQTDAAINPGNSGGPLVNLKGEVIGINTAIASNHHGSEGVGFSIPINLAKWIMTQLVATGRVSRGRMGVELGEIEPDQAVLLGLERPRGASVMKVLGDSPAASAGVRVGDLIVRFNGTLVLNTNHLINLVSMAPIGRKARVLLMRDRREIEIEVMVGERDATLNVNAASAPAPRRPAGSADPR